MSTVYKKDKLTKQQLMAILKRQQDIRNIILGKARPKPQAGKGRKRKQRGKGDDLVRNGLSLIRNHHYQLPLGLTRIY